MNPDSLTCKVCTKSFSSLKGKHLHISKLHDMSLKKYYKTFYPKFSLLYKKPIPFKNINQYQSTDFVNRDELIEWSLKSNQKEVKDYLIKILKDRKEDKKIKFSLSEIELELCDFPTIDVYKKVFGSYSHLCKEIGFENHLNKNIPSDFFDFEDNPHLNPEEMRIFVDTREQKPINFINSELMKLDFGDYTAASPYYDYTYIDRKSEQDFKSTLSGKNFERFKRELDRSREFDSYVFVVVESDIDKIKKNNLFSPHKSKLPYIWHNLKELCQDYKDCCQFVFAGNRNGLKKIIPKILLYGKQLWKVDLQYFINKQIRLKNEQ